MKTLFLSVISLLLVLCLAAQYNGGESAVGIRLGGAAGLTYKKFFNKNFAFEGLLVNNFEKNVDGMVVSALLEKHAALAGNRFSALIGAGPSYSFNGGDFGMNGTIGFDWRVLKSPLNLQVDWMPAYYFGDNRKFSFVNGAFSIRYILNRRRLNNREED